MIFLSSSDYNLEEMGIRFQNFFRKISYGKCKEDMRIRSKRWYDVLKFI